MSIHLCHEKTFLHWTMFINNFHCWIIRPKNNSKNFSMTNIFKTYTIKIETNRTARFYIWTLFVAMFSLLSFDIFFSEINQIEIVHYLFVAYSVYGLSIIYEIVVNILGSDRLLDGVFEFLYGFSKIIVLCLVPFCVFLLCKSSGWTDIPSLAFLGLLSLTKKIQYTEGRRLRISIFKKV